MGGADVANVRAFVGLDVHERQTHAGVLDPVTGEVRVERMVGRRRSRLSC
jgi:hypothetical protein